MKKKNEDEKMYNIIISSIRKTIIEDVKVAKIRQKLNKISDDIIAIR